MYFRSMNSSILILLFALTLASCDRIVRKAPEPIVVDSPESSRATVAPNAFIIYVTGKDSITYEMNSDSIKHAISIEELDSVVRAYRATDSTGRIAIRTTKDDDYETVRKVMKELEKADVKNFGLITE